MLACSHHLHFDYDDTSDPSLSTPIQRHFDRAAFEGCAVSYLVHSMCDPLLDPDFDKDDIDLKYFL